MKVNKTEFLGLFIIEPKIFSDERGTFFDSYDKKEFENIGITADFVQNSRSISKKGVLRGLHFQKPPFARNRTFEVIKGRVLDVIVDLRKNSKTYGEWFSIELKTGDKKILFISKGLAHGFLTLEDNTEIQYQFSDFYNKEAQSGLIWDDKNINIDWKLDKYSLSEEQLILSKKDKKNLSFREIEEMNISF